MEEKDILSIGDPFIALREQLEKHLSQLGFNPPTETPGPEPTFNKCLSGHSEKELKDDYDKNLSYYDFLTDTLTKCEIYLETTKVRSETVRAKIYLQAAQDKTLTNAETRKAYVQVHPAFLAAIKDYLYFKQMHSATDQRRKKISKRMDRLYRELMLRNQEYSPISIQKGEDNKTRIKRMFRPIS